MLYNYVEYALDATIYSVFQLLSSASLLVFYVTSTKETAFKIFISSLFMASGIVVMHYIGVSFHARLLFQKTYVNP